MSYHLLDALARTPMPSAEKNVLMAMACHAHNETFETFVGTKTLVGHSGLTRRYVIDLRHRLLTTGWLVKTGQVHKKYGTAIYRIATNNIPAAIREACGLQEKGVLPAAQGSAPGSTVVCSTVHPNQSEKSVTKKGQVKTSAANAGLVYAPENQQSKSKQEKQEKDEEGSAPENGDSENSKSDTKLVTAWKAAHLAAGLKLPEMSALECFQLSQIAKGAKALDYSTIRDVLIPYVVSHWQSFCAYAKTFKHVHWHSKAPFPALPNAGFLLKYRKAALEFLSFDAETAQFYAKTWPAKFGNLPKGVPKPKGWNSPIWKGHAEMAAPSEVADSTPDWDSPPELP